jgi:hypothetical protein
VALPYPKEIFMLLEVEDTASLLSPFVSRENPKEDFIEDLLLEKDGLPSGPLGSSSKKKGRQSSWELSSIFLTWSHSDEVNSSTSLEELLLLHKILEFGKLINTFRQNHEDENSLHRLPQRCSWLFQRKEWVVEKLFKC